MGRTSGAGTESATEAEHSFETAFGWDLTGDSFIEEFDQRKEGYRVRYDSVRASPSIAVSTIVSNVAGMDPSELDPLYERIDGDALDTASTAEDSSVSRLICQYDGYEITVGPDDVIEGVAG